MKTTTLPFPIDGKVKPDPKTGEKWPLSALDVGDVLLIETDGIDHYVIADVKERLRSSIHRQRARYGKTIALETTKTAIKITRKK
jgi:hypothetical protein